MRAFIVICLVATAFAAPQGYNYQSKTASALETPHFLQEALQNTKLMQSLLSSQNTFPLTGGQNTQYQQPQQQQYQQQQYQPQQYQQQQYQQQQYQQQQYQPQPQISQPQVGFTQHQQQPQFPQYQTPAYNHPAPVVTKDIYVHVAPEEPEEPRHQVPQLPVAPPRKHYRIVFIKAPTQKASSAAVRVQQAPTEEKTIIYVLTKKPDPIDLQASLQVAAPKQPSKPEVYFIKYKTQEEAQHAQRTIQAQYDQLGGTTQVSDEGVAPVTSVIGSLDQQQGSTGAATFAGNGYSKNVGTTTTSSSSSGSSSGSSNYLPPVVRI